METKQPHKKHRLRRPIPAPHKEPVAAVTAGLLLAVLLIIFGLGVFMIRDYVNYEVSPKIETTTNASMPTDKKLAPIEVTVVSSRYSDGDSTFVPMPSMQFLIVDVDVVHHLDAPTWLSPLLQSYAMDNNGKKYELSPVTLQRPFDAHQYKIGEHATGELSYMIPKDASGLVWCYDISNPKFKVCKDL